MGYSKDNGVVYSYDITSGFISSYKYMNKAKLDGFNPVKIHLVITKQRLLHRNKFWFKEIDLNLKELKIRFEKLKGKGKHKNKGPLDFKKCNYCFIIKSKDFFYERKANIDKLEAYCKDCCLIRNRKNKKGPEYSLNYYKNNSNYIKQRLRNRYNSSEQLRIVEAIRRQHRRAHKSDIGYFLSFLGCNSIQFKNYIESLFEPGMTWLNWSRNGWHLDHIIPLCSLDLTDIENVKKVCHYTNLRPLWASENLRRKRK